MAPDLTLMGTKSIVRADPLVRASRVDHADEGEGSDSCCTSAHRKQLVT